MSPVGRDIPGLATNVDSCWPDRERSGLRYGRYPRQASLCVNLPAPEGFRGFDPSLPVTIRHRHLPRRRQEGATYAVTFRQADALPQSRIDELRRLRQDWQAYAREFTRRVDAWLDEGAGSCVFRERDAVDLLATALTSFTGATTTPARMPSCRITPTS